MSNQGRRRQELSRVDGAALKHHYDGEMGAMMRPPVDDVLADAAGVANFLLGSVTPFMLRAASTSNVHFNILLPFSYRRSNWD